MPHEWLMEESLWAVELCRRRRPAAIRSRSGLLPEIDHGTALAFRIKFRQRPFHQLRVFVLLTLSIFLLELLNRPNPNDLKGGLDAFPKIIQISDAWTWSASITPASKTRPNSAPHSRFGLNCGSGAGFESNSRIRLALTLESYHSNPHRASLYSRPTRSIPSGSIARQCALATRFATSTPKEARTTQGSTLVRGPSIESCPDYSLIHGPLGPAVDYWFLRIFHDSLFRQVSAALAQNESPSSISTQLPSAIDYSSATAENIYHNIIALSHLLNRRIRSPLAVQYYAQQTLISLFPRWFLAQYRRFFSTPFPAFSARMNAWATRWMGTWLMGECVINDVVLGNATTMATNTEFNDIVLRSPPTTVPVVLANQGLLVQRCRFLEASGCASVCVHSCKIPTETFFREQMGIPLLMEPNYDTFECQFSFGVTPDTTDEQAAMSTPCLMRCSTSWSLRQRHSEDVQEFRSTTATSEVEADQCPLMEVK